MTRDLPTVRRAGPGDVPGIVRCVQPSVTAEEEVGCEEENASIRRVGPGVREIRMRKTLQREKTPGRTVPASSE